MNDGKRINIGAILLEQEFFFAISYYYCYFNCIVNLEGLDHTIKIYSCGCTNTACFR